MSCNGTFEMLLSQSTRYEARRRIVRAKSRSAGGRHAYRTKQNYAPIYAAMSALVFGCGLLVMATSAQAKPHAYVFNVGSGTVSVIDTEAQKVVDTIDAGLRVKWFSAIS